MLTDEELDAMRSCIDLTEMERRLLAEVRELRERVDEATDHALRLDGLLREAGDALTELLNGAQDMLAMPAPRWVEGWEQRIARIRAALPDNTEVTE